MEPRLLRTTMAGNAPHPARLYPCTNCGMAPLPRDAVNAKLRALAADAASARREIEARERGA